jgi:hypothetical protein
MIVIAKKRCRNESLGDKAQDRIRELTMTWQDYGFGREPGINA